MFELENNENPPKDKGYKPKTAQEIALEVYKEESIPSYKPGIATNIDINKATETLGLENRPELGTQFLQERIKQVESQKIYDEAKEKADKQGFFGELVGFVAQVAAGAVGGTLEGLGALLDPTMIDSMEKDNQSFGRMLSDWGTKTRELGQEYGVHVNPEAEAEGFSPWSREWWLSGAADTVGSVIGFLIPVAGEAKALSMAGTALQGLNTLGKAGKIGSVAKKGFNIIDDIVARAPELTKTEAWAVDGIHKAIVSRHMESTMEAKQVFDTEYKKFTDAGLSEPEARAKAAEGAAFTYRYNWGALVTDIPQYLLMLRGPKLSKVIDDVKLAKVAGTSEGLARIEGFKKYLFGMSSEAGEEAYQFIVSEEGKHDADVKAGLVEDNTFEERMEKYSKDANLWSSAVFGALGGGIFQAAGPKIMDGVRTHLLKNATEGFSESANRIAEFHSRKETILKNVAKRQEAVLSGDEDAIKAANKQMSFDIGINAAKVGNLNLALDGLEQLKNLSDEERKQYGVDDDFINSIEETKKNVQLSAELWQDNYRRYGSESAESISIREFHLKNYNTDLPGVKQKVDELINNLPRIGEVTIHGKKAMEAKLNLKAGERTLNILNWKLKNQKLSNKAKEALSTQIEVLSSELSSYKDAFDSTLNEFKKELNDADRLVLKTLDGKMGEDLTKAKSTQNLYNQQINQLTEELNFFTSKAGQAAVQEEIKKQADKVVQKQNKAKAEAKHEQEEQELAGEETGPDMSLSELDNMIKSGAIDENILDDKAKQALKDYRAGLTPDKNLQPTDETTETPEIENTEEKTRDVKEEITVTSKASNTDGIFATPENVKGVEDMWFGDDKSLQVNLKTPNALAWLSYYNLQAQDKDKTKANKALADFLEGPYDLKDVTLRFEIDFNYLNNYKDKTFPEIKAAIANKQIPENIAIVPIKAILEKDGKPIEHEGEQLSMHLHRGDYENFDDTIRETAEKQLIEQKTQILKAYYEGKTLFSKITSESNGFLNVAYTENREMSKNSLKDIASDPTKIEFMYGSNDFYLTPNGEVVNGLPATTVKNGAIYAKVKTANGSNFPLRLHAENLSRDEAYVVYRLVLEILKDSNKATENITKDIIDGMSNAKNPVLSEMASYLDLNNITHKDLLNHFVFNGYTKTKNTGDSKLYIVPSMVTTNGQTKPAKIIYGAKADYTLDLFNTATARERFITHLQKARRRQVDVTLLDKPEYKKYLVDNMILTSNAIPNEKGRLFVQPTVTYDTNFTTVNEVAKKENSDVLSQDVSFEPMQFTTVAYDKNINSWIIKTDEDAAIGGEKKFTKDGWTYTYAPWLEEDKQYSKYKFNKEKKSIDTVKLSEKQYIEAKGDIDDNPFSVKPISFNDAKQYWENYKKSQESLSKFKEEVKIPTTTEIESDNIEDINIEQGSTIASLLGNPTPLIKNVEEKKVVQPVEVKGNKDLSSIFSINENNIKDLKAQIISNPEKYEFEKIENGLKITQGVRVSDKGAITINQFLSSVDKAITISNRIHLSSNGESTSYIGRGGGIGFFNDNSVVDAEAKKRMLNLAETIQNHFPNIYQEILDYAKSYKGVVISYGKRNEETFKKADFLNAFDSFLYSEKQLSNADFLKILTFNSQGLLNDNIKEQRRLEALKRKKDGNDSAFKLISPFQIDEKKNIYKEEAAHIRSLLPKEIAIKLSKDYINVLNNGEYAIGLFTDNMIYISEKGPRGTAYHEAFHAVFRTMLTPTEQHDIYREAFDYLRTPRKEEIQRIIDIHKDYLGNDLKNGAQYIWAEEELAEEFEAYMLGYNNYPSGIKGLFERLKNWIKDIFSNKQTFKKLFRDIRLGKYKNSPVKLSRAIAYKTLISLPGTNDTFTPEEIKEITQQLTFAALKDVKDISDLEKVKVDNIKNEVYNLINIAIDTQNEELEDRANKVLDNFTYFTNEVINYLGLVMNLEENEELVEDNDGNLIPKSSYEVSGKSNASKNIKFLIALTPRFKSYDVTTNKKEYDTQGTYLGLPRFSDFGNSWNKLEKNLSGIVPIMKDGILVDSFDLMLEKLEHLSKYHPELGYIANTLRGKDNLVKTQFNFTFSRFKGNYIDHLISGNPGAMTSKISNADSFRKEKAIANIWAVNMAKKLGMFENQRLVYSPEKLGYLKNIYAEMRKNLAKDSIDGKPSARTIQLLDMVLDMLGISIKPEALVKWVDEEQVSPDTQVDQLQISKLNNFVLKLDKALIADKTNSIFNRRGDINGRLDGSGTNNHILDQKFFHTELTAHQAEFEKISGESTIIGPDGNKIWIYQDNNLISKTISAIQAGDTSYLDLLAQTPYAQNSLWAKWLRDFNNAQKFDIDIYGNYKEEGAGDAGDKASDLKDPDKFNDTINKYLAGVYVGLAEADKSQQYYLSGPPLKLSQVTINPDNGQLYYDNASAESVTILYNYFADEVNRMVHAHSQLHGEDKLAPEKQIMYYHFAKTPGDGKGNCFKSYLFPNMDLEAMGITTEGIPKVLAPDNMKVRTYIEKVFLDLVKRDLEKASEFGIIEKVGNIYKNRTIDANLINKIPEKKGDRGYGGNVAKAIADYTLNSIIANVEQTKLFNGDPALYKNKGDGFEDFRKRIPAAIASGKDIRIFKDDKYEVRSHYTSAVIENIESPSNYFSNEDNLKHIAEVTKLSLEKVKNLFKPYLSVNQTDAQSWITIDAYRERMVGYGKWSNKHEDAYNRIKTFKMLPEDITLFAQPVKTVHAEMKYQNGVMSMQYNKQSEAVLLPDVIRGLQIEKLLKAMETQKIDHVIVLDGKKAGAIGVTKITNENNELLEANDIKLNATLLSYKHLMLQQDLPTKRIKDTMVGTQATKNTLAVLDLSHSYGGNFNGKDLFERYHSDISKLSDIGLAKVHKEFGYNPKTGRKDLNVLYKTLDKLFKGEVSNNISNGFKAKIPIEAIPQIRKRVQNKINSFITKKTVKLKQLGGAMIQLSNFGWMNNESNIKLDDTVKDGIIWFKSPSSELKPARLKDGKFKAAQILIPHSAIVDAFNSLTEVGIIKKSYKQMTHNELKALISPEVLKGISYRIPNQGPASNDVFDIVGILPPEMGDTMISFKEITTKTGSDFDIDKSFVILPNFKYDENQNKLVIIKDETEQGLQNRRLESMILMLSNPEKYAQMMAPLDDPWLKDLCAELFPETNKAKDLNFFTGTSQLETKSLFDNAKNLVGVIANHMSHHNLTKHENVFYMGVGIGKGFKPTGEMFDITHRIPMNFEDGTGGRKMKPEFSGKSTLELIKEGKRTATSRDRSKSYNQQNIKVGDTIEFYSTQGKSKGDSVLVEVTKAPYKLSEVTAEEWSNLEGWESSRYEQLLKEGYEQFQFIVLNKGENYKSISLVSANEDEDGNLVENTLGAYMNAIVDAAKDPFISRANINQFTAPTTFMLARTGVNREWITAFIGQPILIELVAEINKTEGRISELVRDVDGRIITALDKILKKYGYTENSSVFKSKVKTLKFPDVNKISYDDLKNTIKGTGNVPQLKVLAQFLWWQNRAKDLNELIKACKSDTNGATKDQTSATLQNNLLEKLVKQNTFGNLDKLIGYTIRDGNIEFNGTRMIGTYHKNSVLATLDIFSDTFMSNSPAFLTSMYTIAQSAGYPFLQNVDIANTIVDELYAAVASESSIFYSSKEEINKLLYGKGAPIKWGDIEANALSLADRVLQAKDIEEFKDNLFIQSLDVRPGFGDQPSLLYLSPKNLDKDAKDNMFLAWEDVLELDKALGEDLIRYAYYSSGFKNSFGTFYEHIPVSWMIQSGYADFISQKMKELSNPQATAGKETQIFKHLYENNELVQHAPQSLIKDIEGVDRQYAFGLALNENPNLIIGVNATGGSELKRFLKIVVPIRNQLGQIIDSKTNLYQLGGYSAEQAIYVRTNKLGYSKGGLIIKEYGGNGSTSIFEENNVTLPQEIESLLGENLVFPEPIITEYTVIEKKQKPDNELGEDYNICKNRE